MADAVLRAMTDDGGFRAIAAVTTDAAAQTAASQGASGRVEELIIHLVTGAVLVRETMAPSERVQLMLIGKNRKGQIVADSNPDGSVRALVRGVPDKTSFSLGDGALLQVMRSLPSGEVHKGIIEVPSDASVSTMLTVYMKSSEQVDAITSVGRAKRGADVTAAGYLVQLLPELSADSHAELKARLDGFADVSSLLDRAPVTPHDIVSRIFEREAFTILGDSSLAYGCGCDRLRVLSSLAMLPADDINQLTQDQSPLEISCDYCGKTFRILPEELRGLSESS